MTTNLCIYVLRLQENKFFVGITTDYDLTLKNHLKGTASSWTKLYPVIDLLIKVEVDKMSDVKDYTLKYMCRYGIENVRGEPYSLPQLTEDTVIKIEQEIKNHPKICSICKSWYHNTKQCGSIPRMNNTEITQKTIICYRCKRRNHTAYQCVYKDNIEGYDLDVCYNCGREDHRTMFCTYTMDVYGRDIKPVMLGRLFNYVKSYII